MQHVQRFCGSTVVAVASQLRFIQSSFNRGFCYPCSTESKEDPGNQAQQAPILTEALWAMRRDRNQKLVLKKIGMIPGIISDFNPEIGLNENQLIYLKRKQIWGLLTVMGKKPFMSRMYDMEIHTAPESEEVVAVEKVFPRRLYLMKGRREILNLALVKVRSDVKLKIHIPLKFMGRMVCPGLIEGGTLLIQKKTLSCLCFPDEIPSHIEVDVSKLNIGDRILVRDLQVDLQYKRQEIQVICEIIQICRKIKSKRWYKN
eukprot:c20364_g1_i1 orf=169-945(-)